MAREAVSGIPFMQVIDPERGVLRQRSNCHDCERVAALYPETWPFPGEKTSTFQVSFLSSRKSVLFRHCGAALGDGFAVI